MAEHTIAIALGLWLFVALLVMTTTGLADGRDFGKWLTSADHRQRYHQAHPLAVLWRSLWAPPAFLALAVLCVVLLVMYGPSMAGRRWRDGI